MPNEVDVELFRSFSPYNIYLMQLHGSGLLGWLKVLLSLFLQKPLNSAVHHFSTRALLYSTLALYNRAAVTGHSKEAQRFSMVSTQQYVYIYILFPLNLSLLLLLLLSCCCKQVIRAARLMSHSFCALANLDGAGEFILITAPNDVPKQTGNTSY